MVLLKFSGRMVLVILLMNCKNSDRIWSTQNC
uniref:Uncharacterized protein n=1 Tax=Rhizophora mucronata TaxID=61149 RepID=A0A2P2PJA0_RHIMU